MTIINGVADLDRIMLDYTGNAYWTADPELHRSAAFRVSQHVSEKGHAAGLRYGEDWSAFLDTLDSDELMAVAAKHERIVTGGVARTGPMLDEDRIEAPRGKGRLRTV